jgi:hypothetical protein
MRRAVCLLCFSPNDIWINFLATFTQYDLFIMVDDTSKPYTSPKNNVMILSIPDQECNENGFVDVNFEFTGKPTAWGKALYYFSMINTEYDQVWFLEEDVFIYNEATLSAIDQAYPNSDLLTPKVDVNSDGTTDTWVWVKVDTPLLPPYYNAMVCANRSSKALLAAIGAYAKEHSKVFFLEALLPTLCHKGGLVHDVPPQMSTVVWRETYDMNTVSKDGVYHPVKTIEDHQRFRDYLATKGGRRRTRKRRRRRSRSRR